MTATLPRATTETEAEALARLYDLDMVDDPGDLDLYLALAARADGPILELAVGTGRLAGPLAAAGHQVTGVDRDPAMLARARRRFETLGGQDRARLTLVEADILGLRLDRVDYRLAFIALNSLLLLGSHEQQRLAFRTIADHLAPGGIAAVDVWLPDPQDLVRFDGRIGLEYHRPDPESGRLVVKSAAANYDPSSQHVELVTIYEEGAPGEPAIRWLRTDQLRFLTADELRAAAEDAGLEVETIAGGLSLEPLSAGSERAVLVATKP
jgi:SAM-dependent methyltransferase